MLGGEYHQCCRSSLLKASWCSCAGAMSWALLGVPPPAPMQQLPHMSCELKWFGLSELRRQFALLQLLPCSLLCRYCLGRRGSSHRISFPSLSWPPRPPWEAFVSAQSDVPPLEQSDPGRMGFYLLTTCPSQATRAV